MANVGVRLALTSAARLNEMRLEREEGRRHGRSGGRRVSMKKKRRNV